MTYQILHRNLLRCAGVVTWVAAATAGQANAQNLHIGVDRHAGMWNVSAGIGGVAAQVAIGHESRGVRGIRESVFGARCATFAVWVPEYYTTRCETVYVPGCWRDVWVDPVYDYVRDACGKTIRICVRAGYWTRVQDPGRYETREVRVLVPGHWEYRS